MGWLVAVGHLSVWACPSWVCQELDEGTRPARAAVRSGHPEEEPQGVDHRGNSTQRPLGFGISRCGFTSCLHPVAFCSLGFLTCKVGPILHPLQDFAKI